MYQSETIGISIAGVSLKIYYKQNTITNHNNYGGDGMYFLP